jgi:hypothetical protein
MVGNVYQDYTVVDDQIKRRKNGAILFHVNCKCGKEAWCSKQELETGKRNRCDACGKIKRFGARIDNISINFFHNYKRNAQSRNIEFSITLEYVADLFRQQKGKCALSGMDIDIKGAPWKGQTGSLDRIDSTKGYVEGNVQWVHKVVNELKWDLDEKEFFSIVKYIYEHKHLNNYGIN